MNGEFSEPMTTAAKCPGPSNTTPDSCSCATRERRGHALVRDWRSGL